MRNNSQSVIIDKAKIFERKLKKLFFGSFCEVRFSKNAMKLPQKFETQIFPLNAVLNTKLKFRKEYVQRELSRKKINRQSIARNSRKLLLYKKQIPIRFEPYAFFS